MQTPSQGYHAAIPLIICLKHGADDATLETRLIQTTSVQVKDENNSVSVSEIIHVLGRHGFLFPNHRISYFNPMTRQYIYCLNSNHGPVKDTLIPEAQYKIRGQL